MACSFNKKGLIRDLLQLSIAPNIKLQNQNAIPMLRFVNRPLSTSHRQRMQHPNHGLKLLFRKFNLISSSLLLLFGFSRFWSGLDQQVSQPDNMPCDPPHVEYRMDSDVSSSTGGVLRYDAYHKVMMQNGQCDPSMQPLTVEGWTNYMMGDHVNRLSMELTNVLKVCLLV